MLCQAQLVGFVFFSFSAWPQICRAALLCGAVQADETKAANHIDFTSVPYEGPALKKGQELLAQSREQAKQETAKGPSLQRGWYYSGQLDHMVLWEKGACLPGRKRHATAAFSSCICVSLSLSPNMRVIVRCLQIRREPLTATRCTKRATRCTVPSQQWPRCATHKLRSTSLKPACSKVAN